MGPYDFCANCPLKDRPFVPAQECQHPRLIIVGEAPGQNEAREGEPFVGQSGDLLNAVLANAGINRTDCYITNVLGCHPEGNVFNAQAATICQPRLQAEIAQWPNAPVLALGAQATNALLGPGKITERVGMWSGRVMCGYHPAYILRFPSALSCMTIPLHKALQGKNVLGEFKTDYTILTATDLQHRPQEVFSNGTVCLDIESASLARNSQILSIAMYDGKMLVVIPKECIYLPATKIFLEELFASYKIVGHNMKFDCLRMRELGLYVYPTYDTMLAHYVLDESSQHGLKYLSGLLLDAPEYEKELTKYIGRKKDYSLIPDEVLYKYNAQDVYYNLILWEMFEQELKAQGLFDQPFMFPLMAAQEPFIEMEARGVLIHKNHAKRTRHELMEAMKAVFEKLTSLCGREFNPRSPKKVAEIIYDYFALPVPRSNKFAARSTCKAAMSQIMDKLSTDHPAYEWLKCLSEFKSLSKLLSSYINNTLDRFIGEDDRVHPTYKFHGTEIGRLSASDPAIQTIPRKGTGEAAGEKWGKKIKDMFIAPEGYVLIQADYSQAELRVAGCLSNDAFLLDAYANGKDLHGEAARQVFGDDFTPEQRNLCKSLNFALIYGGSAVNFARDHGLSMTVAKEIESRYHQMMQGFFQYRKDQFELLCKQGYVDTIFGRRRRFPLVLKENLDEAQKACVHMPVSSTASDLTVISFIWIYNYLKAEGIDACPVITVHDSIIVEAPEYKLKDIAWNMKNIMEETGREYFPQIRWKADVDYGKSWGSLEGLEL